MVFNREEFLRPYQTSMMELSAKIFNGFSKRIRVPKQPFHFFYKLKYEIRKKVLIFVSILKLRHKKSD